MQMKKTWRIKSQLPTVLSVDLTYNFFTFSERCRDIFSDLYSFSSSDSIFCTSCRSAF